MKLPALLRGASVAKPSGTAPKPTRLRSVSYGAVASPFLSVLPPGAACSAEVAASTTNVEPWRRRVTARTLGFFH